MLMKAQKHNHYRAVLRGLFKEEEKINNNIRKEKCLRIWLCNTKDSGDAMEMP